MAGLELASITKTVEIENDRFLLFSLDDEGYGIDIKYVTEIIGGIQQITEIPQLPKYIKGIINLRGKIIPTMDVRLRFKKKEKEYDERTCIIVTEVKDMPIGLIVDRVLEVMNIPNEDIASPPQFANSYHHKYIKGIGKIGKDIKLLLDCERLLSDEELENVSDLL